MTPRAPTTGGPTGDQRLVGVDCVDPTTPPISRLSDPCRDPTGNSSGWAPGPLGVGQLARFSLGLRSPRASAQGPPVWDPERNGWSFTLYRRGFISSRATVAIRNVQLIAVSCPTTHNHRPIRCRAASATAVFGVGPSGFTVHSVTCVRRSAGGSLPAGCQPAGVQWWKVGHSPGARASSKAASIENSKR